MSRLATLLSTVALSALCLTAASARAGSPAPASQGAAPALQLQISENRAPSATLFLPSDPDPVPASIHQMMLSEVRTALLDNLVDFDHATNGANDERVAGGGDGSGGLALIAGILGFFPGFGLGHLITGDIGGFLLFLVIDLVIVGVFFVVFPIAIAGFWYVPALIVIVIERVVEAFSAANSATRDHYADLLPAAGPQTVQRAQALSVDLFRF